MSFSAPSSARGKLGAAAEIEHVARLGDFLGPAPRSSASCLRNSTMWRGVSSSAAQSRFSSLCARACRARAPAAMAKRGQRRQLAGERLGRGDADLGPGKGRQHDVGFARDASFRRTLTTASVVWPCALASRSAASVSAVSPDCEMNSAAPSFGIDRIAIAQFRRDVGFHRQARQLLEPVFADQAGIIGRAAGRDGQPRAPSPAPRASPCPARRTTGPAGSR